MLRWSRRVAAGVLAPLFVLAAAGSAADAPAWRGSPAGLPADAARMYGFVTTPHSDELGWQRIPWLTDLGQGIRQAKEENRPLVLFVSGDEPLEKC